MAKMGRAKLALEILRLPSNGLQPMADLQKAAIGVLRTELQVGKSEAIYIGATGGGGFTIAPPQAL